VAQTSGGRVAKLSYEERQRVADKREQVRALTIVRRHWPGV
jgi:hypothetical protein